MNIKELKTLLKENKIHFYTYWDKKRLIALANEHDLLPKTELEKEKSKDPRYDRLKTIKQNPRTFIIRDIETDEKNLSIDLQSGKIYRSGPSDDYLLGKDERSLE